MYAGARNKEVLTLWTYPDTHPRELPSLVLAYIGDAVFELYVRLYLVKIGPGKVRALHNEATALVKASSQANFLQRIEHLLTEEELGVARRGRNAKSGHVPKNADTIHYRMSTGLEALIGYLFLIKNEDRIKELLDFLLSET